LPFLRAAIRKILLVHSVVVGHRVVSASGTSGADRVSVSDQITRHVAARALRAVFCTRPHLPSLRYVSTGQCLDGDPRDCKRWEAGGWLPTTSVVLAGDSRGKPWVDPIARAHSLEQIEWFRTGSDLV